MSPHAIKRHTDETHAAVLRLVEELIAVGARDGSHSPTKVTACTLEAIGRSPRPPAQA